MIGQRIRYYRKTKSLTQEELARGICSVSYLSKIENGDAKSSEDVIELLCERLGISPTEEQLDVNILGLLNEWNYLIILRKYEEAEELHSKIKKYLPFIEDPLLLSRYDLFLIRFYLIKNNLDEAKPLIKKISKLQETYQDPSINFYYYFIKGFYYYYVKEYSEAIIHFEKAEGNLQQTPLNQVEVGVFYYSIALSHSYLFHSTSVMTYAYKALEIFDREYNFSRSSDCQILLGIANRRIKSYSQAEYHFNQALKFAESFNDNRSLGMIYHNIGFVYSNKGQPETAIQYYMKSLSIKDKYDNSNVYITYYLVAKEHLNLDELELSKQWLDKVKKQLKVKNNEEYDIHAKILEYRLEDDFNKEFEVYLKKVAIPYFQNKNIFEHVSEYSSLLADYYYNNSQYKSASEYYKLALITNKKFT
ncbi:helix-turn-helix domain-containing protein [Bacillus sp. Marseille-Q3570]|uniref:helix-turn-helix domain-containing protein n=1 Tax=Bacillus sp. Marseille-Q3570 TaxID=2963522 RepID=UPI0021B6F390|nr:helix-turn-helix domain-containing protein [Bacillus sp. Marseille-Q3570]